MRSKDSYWRAPSPGRGDLRKFALLLSLVLGLAALYLWYGERLAGARSAGGIAAFLLLAGLFFPILLKPLYIPWMYLARALAFVNSHLLLGLIFYTLFALLGLGMRLVRRDPMKRKWEKDSASYWLERRPTLLPADHYERQF